MERWGLQRKYKAGNGRKGRCWSRRRFRFSHEPLEARREAALNPIQAGIKPEAKVGILGRIMQKLFGRRAA